jgi:hypothetical protein
VTIPPIIRARNRFCIQEKSWPLRDVPWWEIWPLLENSVAFWSHLVSTPGPPIRRGCVETTPPGLLKDPSLFGRFSRSAAACRPRSLPACRARCPRSHGCRQGRARQQRRSRTPAARAMASRCGSRRPTGCCRIGSRISSRGVMLGREEINPNRCGCRATGHLWAWRESPPCPELVYKSETGDGPR